MPTYRADRLRDTIREEISSMLRKDLKDPRVGFATITDVEVSRDLRHVRVYVSILGDEQSRAQTMQALESARGFIRTEIGRRIRLRHTPDFTFEYDQSIERGSRVLALISEIQKGEGRDGTT
ncbi:MAG: 30S ribosome-binding factor RbfA [Firmicutes bacterium]|nr:30S ribosome-binding factor RbfA [Bacillota bacterium]